MSVLARLAHYCSLTIARLFLVAWIGGAALFVITSIGEQRSQDFDSATKDRLATIRFPHYYQFGAMCLGISIAATGLAVVTRKPGSRKGLMAGLACCVVSAGIAGYDYVAVYSPLQELITPPGQVRGPEFLTLHERSAFINEIHISLALLGAILLCLPSSEKQNAG